MNSDFSEKPFSGTAARDCRPPVHERNGSFPNMEGGNPLAPRGFSAESKSNVPGMNILVAEDESLLRWTIRRKLEDSGWKVFDAATCTEALDIASRHRIDLLLSDFRLDDGFGDDLARKIGKSRGDAALLLMSGESEGLKAEDFKGMQLLGIMTKPVDLDALVAIVESWGASRKKAVPDAGFAGVFRVCRAESLAAVLGVLENGSENMAFEIAGESFGDCQDLIALLKERVSPGRRLCVVAGQRTFVIENCRRAGVEVVSSVADLEVLSRRMVSGAERSAVLALTGQDDVL